MFAAMRSEHKIFVARSKMVLNSDKRIVRLLTSFIIVVLLFVAGFAASGKAEAARSLCRTDPIVTLSDGTVITLYADVATDVANLAAVKYYLRIPAGLTVVKVEHPIAATAPVESFAYAADNYDKDAKSYTASVVVTLRDKTAVFTSAFMDVVSPVKQKFTSASTTGVSGQSLLTSLKIKK